MVLRGVVRHRSLLSDGIRLSSRRFVSRYCVYVLHNAEFTTHNRILIGLDGRQKVSLLQQIVGSGMQVRLSSLGALC